MEINGISVKCLIDTGSMISTVSESFYRSHMRELEIHPITDLVVRQAGGSPLPYLGFVEAEVRVPDQEQGVESLLLVVPDTEYHHSVPVLIGTNILRFMSLSTGHASNPETDTWEFAIRSIANRNDFSGYVKIGRSVTVPRNHQIVVSGIVHNGGQPGIAMTSDVEGRLPAGLVALPTVVAMGRCQTSRVPMIVKNITSKDIVIPAKCLLGTTHAAEVLPQCRETEAAADSPSSSEMSQGDFFDMFPDLEGLEGRLGVDNAIAIRALLWKWRGAFARGEADLGRTTVVKHRIEMTDPAPFKQRYRRIPPAMVEEVRLHIKQLMDSGVIRPSHSPFSSNVVLVRKKDKSLRMCVDFRDLNRRTIRDAYDLPRIEESLDAVAGAKWFTVFDLKSGYFQLEIEEAHKHRTAFSVGPLGFYEFNRMPFGLAGAPASFQRAMEICTGELNLKELLIYLDDIISHARTFEEHLERLDRLLQRLLSFGLKISPKKCQIVREEVLYLGHMVGRDGIRADTEKIRVLLEWPKPKTLKDLQTFLGFCGYYRKFVEHFARKSRPLNELLGGRTSKIRDRSRAARDPVPWTQQCERAFQQLIEALTHPPVLAYADYEKVFELHVDASTEGLGAVLYQHQNGEPRVIAYASKSLSRSQKKYPAHKLEFLALKWAVTEKFHDYLYGRKFHVLTDNNPLTYVLTTAKLDAAGHRWLAALGAYEFDITYRPGTSNADADGLSRRPLSLPEGGETKTLTAEAVAAISQAVDEGPPLAIMSQRLGANIEASPTTDVDIVAEQKADPDIAEIIKLLKGGGYLQTKHSNVLWSRHMDKFEVRGGVVVHRACIQEETVYRTVIPSLRRGQILRGLHEEIGHPGPERMTNLLKLRYFWPGMVRDVSSWVQTCGRCVRRKKLPDRAPLHPMSASYPFELVSMDFMKLERSEGYEQVLVLTDYFTKFAVAIACRNQTAKTTAKAIYEHLVLPYDVPTRLHSDQGPNFESKVISELCALLGVQKSRTTAYHAMGNGQCERMNRTLLSMLGTLANDQKHRWRSHLASVVHSYNCIPHSSTGYSPFFLFFGRHPKLAIDKLFLPAFSQNHEYIPETRYVLKLQERLKSAYEIAKKSQLHSASVNKEIYDRRMRGGCLRVGDSCLVKKRSENGVKLGDIWEEDVYEVVDQADPQVPVFVVASTRHRNRRKTLHRNNLMPIRYPLRDDSEAPKPQRPRRTRTRSQVHIDPPLVEDSSSDEEVVVVRPKSTRGRNRLEVHIPEFQINDRGVDEGRVSDRWRAPPGPSGGELLQQKRPVSVDVNPHPPVNVEESSDGVLGAPRVNDQEEVSLPASSSSGSTSRQSPRVSCREPGTRRSARANLGAPPKRLQYTRLGTCSCLQGFMELVTDS